MPIKEAPRALGRATPPALKLSVSFTSRSPEVFEMWCAKPKIYRKPPEKTGCRTGDVVYIPIVGRTTAIVPIIIFVRQPRLTLPQEASIR